MERIWIELRRDSPNECRIISDEYENLEKISIAPLPILPDPKKKGRMYYDTWKYLYSNEIDDFIDEVFQAIQEHWPLISLGNNQFDLTPYNDKLDGNEFIEDACFWLYLNSESSLRTHHSLEQDDNIFVVNNSRLFDNY